jgi:DNA polymerase elongation subunit (family B)
VQAQQTLDDLRGYSEESKNIPSLQKPETKKLPVNAKEILRKKLEELTRPVTELDSSLLISATYDGERRVAVLKFYDPEKRRVFLWQDNSKHKPYAFSKETPEALRETLGKRNDILEIKTVEKYEPLSDSKIRVSQIVTTDPLAIGGGQNSIRDLITAWEADIKYYENYIYDKGLLVGTFYRVRNGQVEPVPFDTPSEVQAALQRTLASSKPEMKKAISDWAGLLNQPLPYLKRAALDIEVLSPENRIPNPQEASYPVVAASLISKDLKRVYLLNRPDTELGQNKLPVESEVQFYDTETDLIIDLFTDILDYPIVATFNGDDFDLDYLYHRAQRLEIGLSKAEVPIQLGNNFAALKHGVHIDLYKTFNNKSLQIYAFGNKYSDKTLNGVAEGLLGRTKIEFDGLIGDLPIYELARYNLWDTQLTYDLVSIYNDVLMKLLVVIARVGKMPLDDLSRLGVSNWIRSMFYYEHRRENALIPRSEELERKGGARSEAIIKGKKYKGGLVIEPVTGVHFNVSVLDFASLYPSIIKVYNISYETVNCVHPECKKNLIPEVGTWYCTKRRGIESLVVGSLRDLRVDYYKQLTKSKTLSPEEKELYKVVSQGLKVLLNACFTGDTDVLTPNGIKNIKDVKIGDRVINVNPETMTSEVDEVVQTQVFSYDDYLYHFQNGKQLDLKVTKNHRFIVKQGQRPISFLEAQDIDKRTNVSIPKLQCPKVEKDDSCISIAEYKGSDKFAISFPIAVANHHIDSQFVDLWEYGSKLGHYDKQSKSFVCENLSKSQIDSIKSLGGEVSLSSGHSRYPFEFKKSDFAELCGWIVTEGYVGGTPEKLYENGNHRGIDYRVLITQEFGAGNKRGEIFRDEMRKLLQRMNLRYKEYVHGFRIANPALYRFCVSEIHEGARNKQIPTELLESSLFVKRSLVTSLFKGDGNFRDPIYTTASETLADQLCCLLAELGYRSRKFYDEYGVYRVIYCNSTIGLTKSGGEQKKWLSKERFSGLVYCVTTKKNHTIFAGRNGIFVPVGQSYGVLGFESFPLYCLPAAEAVATLGRYSITKTIDRCRELGIGVVYSDTDSIFLEAPSESQISEVIAWTQKELGIDLDVDKVYRYVAMSERKKNYFGVLTDGTIDVKGLTAKKSQTPQFIKDSFYKALDILAKVNTKSDFDSAREEIKTLLKSDYNRLRERQIPMDQLAFNVMIGKEISRYKDSIPQHVRAAQLLQKNGMEIRAGDIISFVKTTSGDGAKPTKLAKPTEIDVDKYLEYMKSTFDQILGSLGYDFDEILGATKLEDFFWSKN